MKELEIMVKGWFVEKFIKRIGIAMKAMGKHHSTSLVPSYVESVQLKRKKMTTQAEKKKKPKKRGPWQYDYLRKHLSPLG